MAAATSWTPERRQRQAEAIRSWRPWARSTGPTSAAGKARSSRNAYKGGVLQQLRALNIELNRELAAMREFNKMALP